MCVQSVQASTIAGRYEGSGAHANTYSSTLQFCVRTVASWIARSAQRRALRELAGEQRLLSDIGLTREQALREGEKPFWHR